VSGLRIRPSNGVGDLLGGQQVDRLGLLCPEPTLRPFGTQFEEAGTWAPLWGPRERAVLQLLFSTRAYGDPVGNATKIGPGPSHLHACGGPLPNSMAAKSPRDRWEASKAAARAGSGLTTALYGLPPRSTERLDLGFAQLLRPAVRARHGRRRRRKAAGPMDSANYPTPHQFGWPNVVGLDTPGRHGLDEIRGWLLDAGQQPLASEAHPPPGPGERRCPVSPADMAMAGAAPNSQHDSDKNTATAAPGQSTSRPSLAPTRP